jgi:glutaredoxin
MTNDAPIVIIPQSGDHLHGCDKPSCFYCYEMRRLAMEKPKYKWKKKTTHQHRKLREYLQRKNNLQLNRV